MRSIFLLITALILYSFSANAQHYADDITGNWLSTGKDPAIIRIYKSAEEYYGKIIWLKNRTDNGKPKVDTRNPDKAIRNSPVVGLAILSGFKFDGDDEWKSGDIYDPESGKTYNSYLYLKDKNTLKVRGYVGISLFGRTETWSRFN